MNFPRDAVAGAPEHRDHLVQLVDKGADVNADTPVTITLEDFLGLLQAGDLASGATQHYVLGVGSGGAIEWIEITQSSLVESLRNRIPPDPSGGSPGDSVRIDGAGNAYENYTPPALSNATPTRVGATGAAGSGNTAARGNHRHGGVVGIGDLSDVPALSGNAGRILEVNPTADAIVYAAKTTAPVTPRTLSGTLVSATDNPTTVDVILSEPSSAATFGDWTDLTTYITTAAGRHLVTGQLHGMLERTQDGTTWDAFVPVGGGDRAGAEIRLLYQTADDLGEVFNYIRNVPSSQLTDVDEAFDLLTSQVTAISGATIKIQARYQQQLVGTQGNVGDAHRRTAGRLRFPAGDITIRITNMGEVATTAPPTHQVYILYSDSATAPTAAEYQASSYSSTAGSLAVSDRPNTQAIQYMNIWSAEPIGHLTADNSVPDPNENLIGNFTAGRLVVNGVNGYAYTGWQIYARRGNGTWAWRE